MWSTNRLLWHTNSDFYGIRTPLFMPYEPFLLGVGVVFNLLMAWWVLNICLGVVLAPVPFDRTLLHLQFWKQVYHAHGNLGRDMGGCKTYGGGKFARERALPKTFGPLQKSLWSALLWMFVQEKQSTDPWGGWKTYRTRGGPKPLFGRGVSREVFHPPLFSTPPSRPIKILSGRIAKLQQWCCENTLRLPYAQEEKVHFEFQAIIDAYVFRIEIELIHQDFFVHVYSYLSQDKFLRVGRGMCIAIQMGLCIVIQIDGVYTTFCQEEGILLQKYRDRNGRCIAILSSKVLGSGVDLTLLSMCIEFVIQVLKQKKEHVSFPVGMAA